MSLHPFSHYIHLLARYLRPQWCNTLLMIVLLLASIGLELLNPQILRYFIDTTFQDGISSMLVLAAVLYLGVSLLDKSVSVLAEYLSEKVAWTATNQLRGDLLAHILSLDLSFHSAHTSGELIERIDGDVNELTNFFSKFLVQMLFHIVLLCAMLVALTWVNWILGLVLGMYVLVVMVVLIWLRRPVAGQNLKWREADAYFFGFLGEQLGGMEDLRANGATRYVMRRFFEIYRYWFVTIKKAGLTGATPWILSQTMFVWGGILGLVLGAYLWSVGLASPGTVYLVFAYSSLLTKPLEQILWQLQDLQQAEVCIQRVEELLLTKSRVMDGSDLPLIGGAPELSFTQVNFAYKEGEPILKDVSFTLASGRVLGLLGHTGAGKSTLIRLLFRLCDPQSGKICLDGEPIQQMQLAALRGRIGLITQEVQLFEATVRDNLTFFKLEIKDEQIIEVLCEIGLEGWYRGLGNGLDTQLSAGGAGLSAGEAQLLAFARVFLRDPGIVVLDEASSRLDPATEQVMQRAMKKLFEKRTGITIAHRLSTIQWVDDILLLEKGRVLENGSRSELEANADSQFAQLLQDARKSNQERYSRS